ncbi:HNH endonuclease [Nocardioides panacisoli]|uniref:HNH endonuclease signature motif containing protein n=1 Tax=Nocardioides panacisoli TaxID=627624 RepID=UPI001C62568A|nr:HNH endonuclease signature motif containing protein [Nocardioides panacisoli]QYJ04373.1 HNH endonuclease [Nocardioides panacisoli]
MVTTLVPTHPIVACAETVHAALESVAHVEPVYMATSDKVTALEQLARAESRLAELRLRVMASADDVATERGAHDVAAWLAHQINAEPRAMRADLDLAKDLDRYCGAVAGGMRTGQVSTAQARVITRAIDELPRDVGPDITTKAEAQLVDYASHFRPGQLRRLGRRILDVVAPEVADEEAAKILAEQEKRAQERASLRLQRIGDGTTRIAGLLSDHVADRLETYLHAFTSPRQREGAPGPFGLPPEDQQPRRRQYAHAFAMLLEHLDPANLPHHGGDATAVMVTVGIDQLRSGLATAGLIDGDFDAGPNLTADQARRLACTARIIPVVLGGDAEILDQGRSRRLFTAAQRRAMRLRDRTCRAEGCEVPATWTEAHHLDPWSSGGRTDLADGVLLCSHHHHRAHERAYRTDVMPTGAIRFHRRL